MLRKRLISVILALAAPLSAAGASSGDLAHRLDSAEATARARLVGDPAQARLALARIAVVRSQIAALRHTQGGMLSADQQARATLRLAAIADPLPR